MNKKNTIFIDFDDVIFKSCLRLEQLSGQKIKKFNVKFIGLTNDVFSRENFYLIDKEYLMENCVNVISGLSSIINVEILTKFINPIEKEYKVNFLNYFGMGDIKINFVKIDENKQSYIKKGDFLIDDQINNLENNKYNVLFDESDEFNKDYNSGKHDYKMSDWLDIYLYIRNIIYG